MTCKKCGNEMSLEAYGRIISFTCYICGNIHYPAFPKRPAPTNICDFCGEEYNKRDVRQTLCPKCKRLRGKVKPKISGSPLKIEPWSNKKLEAQNA